jgi:hydroxypyruvate isomerase
MQVATAPPSHGLPFAANCTFLFAEHELLDRPRAAKEAGFDLVEFWWPFDRAVPPADDVEDFVAATVSAGVHVVGLNVYGGDAGAGERGLLSLPHREAEFRAALDSAVMLAERLGAGNLTCLYGNRVAGHSPDEQDALALGNLRHAAAAAARIGAQILIEPISGVEGHPLRTADDAVAVLLALADSTDTENVRLQVDMYHLATNGEDLGTVVGRYAGRIGHVQIADAPGRHEPGTGVLDLDAHLAALQAAGYGGSVALEYIPSDTTEASLAWLARERRSA